MMSNHDQSTLPEPTLRPFRICGSAWSAAARS